MLKILKKRVCMQVDITIVFQVKTMLVLKIQILLIQLQTVQENIK